MGKKFGNDYRLWLEGPTPGTYAEIKGNTSLTVNRSAQTIDTSTKSDYPNGTAGPGVRTMTISADFIPDLPDATGYTLLKSNANSAAPSAMNIQIRKGGSGGATPGDVVFAGSVYSTGINESFGQNGAVTAQTTFVMAAAPTTDLLA